MRDRSSKREKSSAREVEDVRTAMKNASKLKPNKMALSQAGEARVKDCTRKLLAQVQQEMNARLLKRAMRPVRQIRLENLENELIQVRDRFFKAWDQRTDSSYDFYKCIHHVDAAQRRLHRVIKALAKKRRVS